MEQFVFALLKTDSNIKMVARSDGQKISDRDIAKVISHLPQSYTAEMVSKAILANQAFPLAESIIGKMIGYTSVIKEAIVLASNSTTFSPV